VIFSGIFLWFELIFIKFCQKKRISLSANERVRSANVALALKVSKILRLRSLISASAERNVHSVAKYAEMSVYVSLSYAKSLIVKSTKVVQKKFNFSSF
jgi:hypothetical protein